MSSVSDRRKDQRLPLALDVEFTPGSSQGAGVPCSGVTRNVSAGGVYLETRIGEAIENGTPILLKIAVPKQTEESAEPLVLHCEGTVCRIEKLSDRDDTQGAPLGIAVKFDNRPNIEFQSLDSLLWGPG